MLVALLGVALLGAPAARIAVLPPQGVDATTTVLAKDLSGALEAVGGALPGVVVLAGTRLLKATKAPFLPKRVTSCAEDAACIVKLCRPAKPQAIVWSTLKTQASGAIYVTLRRLSGTDGAVLRETEFEVLAPGDAAAALRVNTLAVFGVEAEASDVEDDATATAAAEPSDPGFEFSIDAGVPPAPEVASVAADSQPLPEPEPAAAELAVSPAEPLTHTPSARPAEVPARVSEGPTGDVVAVAAVREHPSLWPAAASLTVTAGLTALAGGYYGYQSRRMTNEISPHWQQLQVARRVANAEDAASRANVLFAVAVSAAATAGLLAAVEWVWPAERPLPPNEAALRQ